MVDVLFHAIAFGCDGLVVCLALGALAPGRWFAPLALTFGACDALASTAGALLGTALPRVFAAQLIALSVAAALALYVFSALFCATHANTTRYRRAGSFLLPVLLSLDNLVAGLRAPADSVAALALATVVVSSAMAFAGLNIGARSGKRFRLVLASRNR